MNTEPKLIQIDRYTIYREEWEKSMIALQKFYGGEHTKVIQALCSHKTTEVHIDEIDNVKTTSLVCSDCGKVIEENYKPKTTCKEI